MNLVWKWLLGIFVVLVLGCAGGSYWLYSSGQLKKLQEQFRPDLQATTVRLDKAIKGNLIRTVSAPGLSEPKSKVLISAQVSARITALPFDEGDQVKAGDVVVRLDDRDLVANLDSARAQLDSEKARLDGAKATYKNMEQELGRRRELFSTKDISKAELDQAEADFQRAESNLRAAEFAIEIAKANISRAEKDLDNAIIKTPIDGVLVKRNAEVGELVVVGTFNNAGTVIMEIADLSKMLLQAKVDEANVAPVKSGQKAKVFFNAYRDKAFEATVQRVMMQRQVDRDGTAYFETELLVEIPKGDQVFWGMTGNADIEVETIRDVVKVPSQAVLDRPMDELPKNIVDASQYIDKTKRFARVVYKVVDGKAVTVPVSIGPSDLTHTIILGGLAADETIITGPFKSLTGMKEGQTVRDETTIPKEQKPAVAATAKAGN
ncbi:MAG: efflux RND transporter periplasmic adaptor subunit [Phycisphaerales bacterium]